MPFAINYGALRPKMSRLKEMSHKLLKRSKLLLNRVYFNVRVVIVIVCTIGLVHEVLDVTEQYLMFPTKLVREIRYHTEKYIQSPALTLCLDKIFDYDKLKGFSDFENLRTMETNSSHLHKQMFQFSDVYRLLSENLANMSMVNMQHYAINMSDFIYSYGLFNGTSFGENLFDDNDIKNGIISYTEPHYFCFTSFSLDKTTNFNRFRSQLIPRYSSINIILNFYHGSVPNVSYNVFASLHSAETIPSFPDDFFHVKADSYYEIKYQIIETTLLPSPYGTDCVKYFNDSHFHSNYDCYTNCEIAEHRKVCNTCLPEMWTYRADLLNKSDILCTKQNQLCYSQVWSEDVSGDRLAMVLKCLKKCKVQCNQVEIRFSVFKWMDKNEFQTQLENYSLLTIAPSKKKKIIDRYEPVINLANLVANIGGIGSFWIGLNVLGAYDAGVDVSKALLAKLKTRQRRIGFVRIFSIN